jgi:hypothetical protein
MNCNVHVFCKLIFSYNLGFILETAFFLYINYLFYVYRLSLNLSIALITLQCHSMKPPNLHKHPQQLLTARLSAIMLSVVGQAVVAPFFNLTFLIFRFGNGVLENPKAFVPQNQGTKATKPFLVIIDA